MTLVSGTPARMESARRSRICMRNRTFTFGSGGSTVHASQTGWEKGSPRYCVQQKVHSPVGVTVPVEAAAPASTTVHDVGGEAVTLAET